MAGYVIDHSQKEILIYDTVREARRICGILLRISKSLQIYYFSSKKRPGIAEYIGFYKIKDTR